MEDTARQEKERSIWNKMASSYDERTLKNFKTAYAQSIQKAQAALLPDQQVLEIGCGTGIISLGIAPRVKKVLATDISPRMIAVAKRKAEAHAITNIEFRVCDGYAIAAEDGTFDAVLLFNILHIVRQPGALLSEAHRLLKPGGQLLCAVDCYAEPVPFSVWLIVTLQRLLNLLGTIPYLHYYIKTDLHHLLAQHAFDVTDTAVLQAVPVNYYLRANKM